MVWDTTRPFPTIRACILSSGMTGVTFLGDPNTGIGFPRGVLLYANQPIPQQVGSIWNFFVGKALEEKNMYITFL